MKMNSYLALLLFAISGIVLWVGIFTYTNGQIEPNELLIDLGKSGATLALISGFGGILQLLLKNRENDRNKNEEKSKFYQNILLDLKSVSDKVENAKLLIQAHRTAKTYGEQMRELINSVIILKNIRRAINPKFPKLKTDINSNIVSLINFINRLHKEFGNNYKRISVLQEIDELRKDELVKSISKIDNKTIEEIDIPATAWQEILKLEELRILIDGERESEYNISFNDHMDSISTIIRSKIKIEEE